MNELDYLEKQLTDRIETRSLKVNSGNIPNFKVYKQVVGEMTGLSLAVQDIHDLRKKLNEADNVE